MSAVELDTPVTKLEVQNALVRTFVDFQPLFDLVVTKYNTTRRMHIWNGFRNRVPGSNIPELQVNIADCEISRPACRTEERRFPGQFRLVVYSSSRKIASDLLSELDDVVIRVCSDPVLLKLQVRPGVRLFDSQCSNATYGEFQGGNLQLATFQWFGLSWFRYPDYKFDTLGWEDQRLVLPI